MMQKLDSTIKGIKESVASKDMDTATTQVKELADMVKMGMSGEGMNDMMVMGYQAMGKDALELVKALSEKSPGQMAKAMKKMEAGCAECHAKMKKP
jgi:hypothetical protein